MRRRTCAISPADDTLDAVQEAKLDLIFPNGFILSTRQITKVEEGLVEMEDWHNIGP